MWPRHRSNKASHNGRTPGTLDGWIAGLVMFRGRGEGKEEGAPGGREGRGLDCAGYITRHSRLSPMRFNARSRTSAAIYPQKCCPFRVYIPFRRVSIPRFVSSSPSTSSNGACTRLFFADSLIWFFFFWVDWREKGRIVEFLVTSSRRNIIIIIIIVFGNIREIWKILLLRNFTWF